MEYVPYTLTTCLDTYAGFPQSLKFRILRDASHAIAYLHGMSPPLIHRDISSNNIMVTKELSAKIIDVGSALTKGTTDEECLMSACPGALVCMPPEAKQQRAYYTEKLDMFSIGIVMIHTLAQKWPIPVDELDDLEPGIGVDAPEVQARLDYLQSDKIGEEHPLTGVIVDCLQTSPSDRPSAIQLARILDDLCQKYPLSNSTLICDEIAKVINCSVPATTSTNFQWTRTRLIKRKWTTSNLAVDAIRQKHQLPTITETFGKVKQQESEYYNSLIGLCSSLVYIVVYSHS